MTYVQPERHSIRDVREDLAEVGNRLDQVIEHLLAVNTPQLEPHQTRSMLGSLDEARELLDIIEKHVRRVSKYPDCDARDRELAALKQAVS